MLLVFVDETADVKFKNYLGFSIALANAFYYPKLKSEAQRILRGIGWDPNVEFKGSYLFSASKGCTDVEIERRVSAAGKLLDLNVARENTRMKFHFGDMRSENPKVDYLTQLPGLLWKVLPPAPRSPGKNLIAVICDERDDISDDELNDAVLPVTAKRGYVMLERAHSTTSNFDTVGIMYADLVGYLAGRIETISNDVELIDGLTEEQMRINGKLRKLQSSKELIGKIKRMNIYHHKEKPPRGSAPVGTTTARQEKENAPDILGAMPH